MLQRKKTTVSNSTGDYYLMSLYSKLQIQAMRLAGIVHLMGIINSPFGFNYLQVSQEAMEYTIRCMQYFEQSALEVYERLRGLTPNAPKPTTQADLIRQFKRDVGIVNQRAFAEGIGKDPSYISKILKKLE